MSVRAAFVSLMLPPLLLLALTSAADQTSCKLIWQTKMPCAISLSALISQVKIWSRNQCSGPQEKCMYELLKYTSKELRVKHTSPVTTDTSTINFFFNSSAPPVSPDTPSSCKMFAMSTSNTTTSTSNNYCLIYNLLEGSGLTQAFGAKEIINKGMCPSMKTATCKVA